MWQRYLLSYSYGIMLKDWGKAVERNLSSVVEPTFCLDNFLISYKGMKGLGYIKYKEQADRNNFICNWKEHNETCSRATRSIDTIEQRTWGDRGLQPLEGAILGLEDNCKHRGIDVDKRILVHPCMEMQIICNPGKSIFFLAARIDFQQIDFQTVKYL